MTIYDIKGDLCGKASIATLQGSPKGVRSQQETLAAEHARDKTNIQPDPRAANACEVEGSNSRFPLFCRSRRAVTYQWQLVRDPHGFASPGAPEAMSRYSCRGR